MPVIVMGYVPVGVFDPIVMVMAPLPEPGAGMLAGLKLTLAPEGRPEADNAIELLNPPEIEVTTFHRPWLP